LATTFPLALAGWGLPIALIGLWPLPLVALIALALVGLSNATLDVSGFTLLQRTVPSRGRVPVLGLLEGVVGLGVATGSLLTPLLINALGIRGALIAIAAILPVVAAVLWPALLRVRDIAIVPEQRLAIFQRVALFEALPLASLEELARAASDVHFADGELLMREGEAGDRYLVVKDGIVEVTQAGRPLRRCGPGEGVGEIALLRRATRTATVRARGEVSAYALDADAFIGAVTGHRVASARAESLIEERLAAGAD
jgi:hypothetical protein